MLLLLLLRFTTSWLRLQVSSNHDTPNTGDTQNLSAIERSGYAVE